MQPLLSVYIDQVLVADCSNWAAVKSMLVARSVPHAFVVQGSHAWNVSIRYGRMTKQSTTN